MSSLQDTGSSYDQKLVGSGNFWKDDWALGYDSTQTWGFFSISKFSEI